MIYDVCFIREFDYAEKIDSYSGLIEYMKQYNKEYYFKMGIYVQKHHCIPSFECNDLDNLKEIWLPIAIHFKAHILRAREFKEFEGYSHNANWIQVKVMGNYTEAFCILKPHRKFQVIFEKEFQEASTYYKKYFKPSTYEAAFGKRKATIIKRKIAMAMSNLDPYVINKRNESIAKYASQRPTSHNAAISKALTKTIIHINTGKFYKGAEAASIATGISIQSIRKCCRNEITSVKSQQFEYGI